MKWTSIITSQGQLHRQWTDNIEVLYTGLHGLSVQRFRLKENGQSYIYKPFATETDVMRELRVYRQIMPWLPEVYPQLIAYSAGTITETPGIDRVQASMHTSIQPSPGSTHSGCWLILEDIGELNHRHTEQVLLEMAELIAQWHRIPLANIAELPVQGQKPPLSIVREEVLQHWEQAIQLLFRSVQESSISSAGKGSNQSRSYVPDQQQLNRLQIDLRHFQPDTASVLSHGDLHAGNYGMNPQGRLIVLDWEHAHAALPYWDLYHLLDMSHPLFPRRMNRTLRRLVLQRYVQSNCQQSDPGKGCSLDSGEFYRDYYRFAILYSLWMLLLIERDLQQPKALWPHSQLLAQRRETIEHLLQCIEEWSGL